MASFRFIDRDTMLRAMGISERTLQRAKLAYRPLDSNATDRSPRLAAVAEQAIEVLGSQEAAERWLAAPAMGLGQRRPIDLLQSSEGTDLVKTLLTRRSSATPCSTSTRWLSCPAWSARVPGI